MIIGIQDEILRLHSLGLLKLLLQDKTTRGNIIWATDAYRDIGPDYKRDKEIKAHLITGARSGVIKNRARKALEQQTERTRQHAEVFTPLWICKRMNETADGGWFPKKNPRPFDSSEKIKFLSAKKWRRYVDARRLEITCGEAPYLVSRYDVATGESIPIRERIGLLDRKLRVVDENTADEAEWLQWAVRAFQSIYGYEFQGDNLLIARVNLLMTFEEYLQERWRRKPTYEEYRKIANIITWNIWQMDGITGAVPYCRATEKFCMASLFAPASEQEQAMEQRQDKQPPCRVYDWRRDNSLEFLKLKERSERRMKFDFIIGNPPYQEDVENKGDRNNPVYNHFMDASYKIADVVELITPARFLFNAGQTPKSWNTKMLNDEHLSVLYYEPDASKIFPNTEIKGGVAITVHNNNQRYGAIGTFVTDATLRGIKDKVGDRKEVSINTIMASQGLYRYADKFFVDFPDVSGKFGAGTGNKIVSNMLDKVSDAFLIEKPQGEEYINLVGRSRNVRVVRYIKRVYVQDNSYIDTYNVAIPEASGSGAYGEALGTPILLNPGEGTTDTFINIGNLHSALEAEAIIKYIKTKFLRALHSIKKVTQHNSPNVWQYVPLQDFTPPI